MTSGRWAGRGHGERLGKSGWQRQRDNARTMRRHRGICHWCGRPGADRIDHVIPLAQGGTDDEANRAPIHSSRCRRCELDHQRARNATRPQYAGSWYATSRRARKAQPWCSICGTNADLTLDHEHGQVECRECNSRHRRNP